MNLFWLNSVSYQFMFLSTLNNFTDLNSFKSTYSKLTSNLWGLSNYSRKIIMIVADWNSIIFLCQYILLKDNLIKDL